MTVRARTTEEDHCAEASFFLSPSTNISAHLLYFTVWINNCLSSERCDILRAFLSMIIVTESDQLCSSLAAIQCRCQPSALNSVWMVIAFYWVMPAHSQPKNRKAAQRRDHRCIGVAAHSLLGRCLLRISLYLLLLLLLQPFTIWPIFLYFSTVLPYAVALRLYLVFLLDQCCLFYA